MLQINGRTFMNLQEAVQWLLDNNALPFQSSANYVANTEIGMGTIVNPSPAKVRIGSLIFFADSKVSTVTGLTENGFIVSDQYNDLVDDVVYVSNVALNSSGHLIVTLSNGDNIDAGLIKQVSGFSINGSQHLIVSYNDGTSSDLGAIFSGSITISGDLTVTGTADANKVTGNEIIEKMSNYYVTLPSTTANVAINNIYVSVSKTGNKVTFVIFASLTKLTSTAEYAVYEFSIPVAVGAKLYTYEVGGYQYLDNGNITGVQKSDYTRVEVGYDITKLSNSTIRFNISSGGLTQNEETYVRLEKTFLLSDNMVP